MRRGRVDTLEHRWLRSAIEFAVAIAAEGQKIKPPIAYPPALKPFLRQARIPGAALGKLRRAIEADPDFRRRLAAGALSRSSSMPIGIEWLRRDDGWEERIAALVAEQRGRRVARRRRRPRCAGPSAGGRPPSRPRRARASSSPPCSSGSTS